MPDDAHVPHLLPHGWYLCIVHGVQRFPQVFAHDNGPIDGQFEVLQDGAHSRYHALHAVDLLAQEDVDWLQLAHLFETALDLEGDIVLGQLVQHVVSEAVHNGLASLSATRAAVLGLDVENGVQGRGRRHSLIAGRIQPK